MKIRILTIILLLTSLFKLWSQLPKGFSYIKDIAPSIQKELRYCHHNNFVGIPIEGYEFDVLITSTATAKALKKVQKELIQKGYSLKIFDAYRPQRAVDHFVRWARSINDTVMKSKFYPEIKKTSLFKLGYIASKSGHSRGSSVDLTIIEIKTEEELDMGSTYDFFGTSSHISHQKLTKKQKKNRALLQKVMAKYNFRPYKNEWWHFTLRNEPFPKTYFNFPIK